MSQAPDTSFPSSASTRDSFTIEAMPCPPDPATIDALADVLVDAVDSGASVSFSGAISKEAALTYWKGALSDFGDRDALLLARDKSGIVGTVQVRGCWQANQRFRGEVMKLLVHRRARKRGIAQALMTQIERRAVALGLTLLVLDTNAGSDADRLYRRLGWTRVGEIPGYSIGADGLAHPTAIFYKSLC